VNTTYRSSSPESVARQIWQNTRSVQYITLRYAYCLPLTSTNCQQCAVSTGCRRLAVTWCQWKQDIYVISISPSTVLVYIQLVLGLLPGVKAAGAWSRALTSVWCQGSWHIEVSLPPLQVFMVCRGTILTLPVRTSVREGNISQWEKGCWRLWRWMTLGSAWLEYVYEIRCQSVCYLHGILYIVIIIIIIIIFINCNWVVTRWQWLFYMYTKYEIGY